MFLVIISSLQLQPSTSSTIGKGPRTMTASRIDTRTKTDDQNDDDSRLSQTSRTGISRVVPFAEAVGTLMCSVLVWGWKVAPVKLYQNLVPASSMTEVNDSTHTGHSN